MLKKMRAFLLVFIFMCSFASCNDKSNGKPRKDPEIENRPEVVLEPVVLTNKSIDEVLKLKYDKAQLICRLWVQMGTELNRDPGLATVLPIDLMEGTRGNVEYSMENKAGPQTARVELNLSNLRNRTKMAIESDNLFSLTYALAVDVTVNLFIDSVYPGSDFAVVTDSMKQTLSVIEGSDKTTSEVIIHNSATSLGDEGSIFRYLTCSLETDVKGDFVEAPIVLDQPL